MTLEEMEALFEDMNDDEYLEFQRIENPAHSRPDLCAFLMLDALCPGQVDMVCAAEHDEIWLDVGLEALAKAATPEQIIDLIRCGVRCDGSGSLAMFV